MNEKAPSFKDLKIDIATTRSYMKQLTDAKRAGDYATAAEIANEISAIWSSISWNFEESTAPEFENTDVIASTSGARFAIVSVTDNETAAA